MLAPLAGLLAVITDLVLRRHGWPTVRLVAFFVLALWTEVSSHPVILWTWLSQPVARRTWTERNHGLMHWWCGRLVRGAERVVGVRWDFDLPDDLGPGPLLAFSQHVSIVDAIAPVYILGNHQGWNLRYTLTRGLRFDPCLDIVGHRIPNHFVARGTGDNTEELGHLRTLAADMEDDECAAIFPGGGLLHPVRAGPGRQQARGTGLAPGRDGGPIPSRHAAPTGRGQRVLRRVARGQRGHRGPCRLRAGGVAQASSGTSSRSGNQSRSRCGAMNAVEVPEDEETRMAWLYEQVARDGRLDRRAPGGSFDHGGGGVNYLEVFGASAAAIAVLMIGTWVVSLRLRNASIVDIVWGAGFVLVAWVSYALGDGVASRKMLLAWMVTLWGGRLAIYLFIRNHGKGEDPRTWPCASAGATSSGCRACGWCSACRASSCGS